MWIGWKLSYYEWAFSRLGLLADTASLLNLYGNKYEIIYGSRIALSLQQHLVTSSRIYTIEEEQKRVYQRCFTLRSVWQ